MTDQQYASGYIYPVDEAIAYFTNRLERTTLSDYAVKTAQKHPAIGDRIRLILEPTVELERRINAAVPSLDRDCEFFFSLDNSVNGEKKPLTNAAWLLMGARACFGEEPADIDGMLASRLALSKEDRDRLFLSYLFDLEEKTVRETGVPAGVGLLELIAGSGINSLTRIKLTELYLHFDEHLFRLAEILRPAADAIAGAAGLYTGALLKLRRLLGADGGVREYLASMHGFDIGEVSSVFPRFSLMAPQTVMIREGLFDGMDVYVGVCVEELAALAAPGTESERMVSVFKLLSDETRLRMLRAVVMKPMYGLELAETFSVTAPTVSYHMTKLVMSGLVDSYFEDGKGYFRANRQALTAFSRSIGSFFGLAEERGEESGE
ncbi:MAG: winged helix-turn-helix transcriptional regulator [Clostridia bacterium]|nr:winged helix-turn-helix transcriptional regulator [Clostridia bacterium]